MLLRFGATLFLGAALLFSLEPMVGKMLMPLLGGAPQVWITCVLFFQAVLLAGYVYAHVTSRLGVKKQASLHIVALALPLLALPIEITHASPGAVALTHTATPTLGLLGLLACTVGLPFFVLSTTTPLVQKWFSHIGHPAGDDPYFLYGASNLGSLLALAAYPAVIEPWLGLSRQARVAQWGYIAFACMVASCAVTTLRIGPSPSSIVPRSVPDVAIGGSRRLRWVLLAFVPSTFLLGVTSYITTDIAPIPLFWVIPLALYLVTFILAFARRPPIPHAWMVRALPFGVTATIMMVLTQASTPMPVIVAVHLLAFFIAAMVCHGELARDRPPPADLTEFYLWVAVGGVLGGVWNGVLAPSVFDRLVEYPLAMVLAAACRRVIPDREEEPGQSRMNRDVAFAVVLCALTLLLVHVGKVLQFDPGGHMFPLLFGVPLFLNYSQLSRPRRFALGLLATLIGGALYGGPAGETLHIERNFFGVLRVTRDEAAGFVQIVHGNTIHGRQRIDPMHKGDPSGYYTRQGPLGQVFEQFHSRHAVPPSTLQVGVIGLGAGGMAAYARPSEHWTYFEIDPAVVRVASDPRYFTFLHDAFPDPSQLAIVVGDARLRLEEARDASFNLLVLDAFSSDAIPTHLLTREAVALYLKKLSPGGLLVTHISNRYLDLAPVVSNLARASGLHGFIRRDGATGDPDALAAGWTPSDWVVLARPDEPLDALARDVRWSALSPGDGRPWTDDFSDLLGAYR